MPPTALTGMCLGSARCAALAGGKTRRARGKVEAEIGKITPMTPGCAGSSPGSYPATKPKDLRLAWSINQDARAALEEEILGKHVLITDHDD